MKQIVELSVGSVTFAMRAKHILQRAGIRVFITRISSVRNEGCGYTVTVAVQDKNKTEQLLKQHGIRIQSVQVKDES